MNDVMRILELLEQSGLGKHMDNFKALIKPSIRLIPTHVHDDDIPVGHSKLGGKPDAPVAFNWPRWGDEHMAFLGQLDLSTLEPSVLKFHGCPAEGLLSFFYAPGAMFALSDSDSAKVFCFSAAGLRRTEIPYGAVDVNIYSPALLKTVVEWTVPGPETYEIQHFLKLGWSQNREEFDLYWDVFLSKFRMEFSKNDKPPKHRFLGNHDPIQSGYIAGGCSLFMQIDSDDWDNMMWGDAGTIYFWIQPEQLQIQQFNGIYVTMECT